MRRLKVSSEGSEYEVVIGRGAWRDLRRLPRSSSQFVLTERRLWNRWGEIFVRQSGLRGARVLFLPAGEQSKSLKRVEEIATQLSNQGADRHSLLVAFGGGVVGDLGGFVASTYMRGIAFANAPTTVVAQVDSAIGGKTGVNVGAAKNLVGTFYPPRLMVADPAVLASLHARAFRSGLYEVIKHAILEGPEFFEQLELQLESLAPNQVRVLEPILVRAAQVKVNVVSRDEREAGMRQVLNLGHTFGHALEELTAYRALLHGEAVAWGLLGVTRLAELLGMLKPDEGARIARLVLRVGRLPSIRRLPAGKILELLTRDKKTVAGRVHWVLPERIGKVRIVNDVPLSAAAAAWRDVQQGARYE
jgi:3-dehydroquinate synthase